MKNVKRLMPYFRQYKWLLTAGILSIMIVAAATIAPVYLFKNLILVFDQANKLEEASQKNSSQSETKATEQVKGWIQQYQNDFLNLIIMGIGLIIILVVFSFLQNYLMGLFGKKVLFKLRKQLYTSIIHLPIGYFHHERRGTVMSLFNTDLMLIERFTVEKMINLLKEPLIIIGAAVTMFYMSAFLTVTVFLLAPVTYLSIHFISKKIKTVEKSLRNNFANLSAMLHETLNNLKLIKYFATEKREQKKFDHENKEYFVQEKTMLYYESLQKPSVELIAALSLVSIIGIGGYQLIHQKISLDQFIAFITALFTISSPLREVSRITILLKQVSVALERVLNFMDCLSEKDKSMGKKTFKQLEKGISFDKVSFSYDNKGQKILRDISFQIHPGEHIGLVGENGSGKSSIISLLTLLYETNEGKISIDGMDIRELDSQSLRQKISIVPQEDFLFYASIKENILYGKPDATWDELIEATKICNAYDFIMNLPQQFDTYIGEDGVRLSGGERQRLSLARAVIRKPELLILDEATSSIDSNSEITIQKSIQQVMANHTTLIIAHHFSNLIDTDKIIVLKKGKIVEMGTHKQLMNVEGEYKRLYTNQNNSYDQINRLC